MNCENKMEVDVLVAGGGVAGVAAAVSAARRGCRTLLLEKDISLGGLATNGYVIGVAGTIEGICEEWLNRMDEEGYLFRRPHAPSIDPEKGKLMLERMLLEAGVNLLYGMYVVEACAEENSIQKVICHGKSGPVEISARMFIDATGDADIAASAGVPYEVGSPSFAGLNMSTTMAFRMANVNMVRYQEASDEWRKKNAHPERPPSRMSMYGELQEKAIENGDLPHYIFPGALMYVVPGTPVDDADIAVMTAHSYYTRNTDPSDLTRQIVEQHEQIDWITEFLKKYVPGFENSRLIGMASQHGVRDSRRIVGEYILRDRDVVCGEKFPDGIARFPEFLDTHHPTNPKQGFIRHVHLDEPEEPAVCRPAQCTGQMHPFVKMGGYEARANPLEYCDVPYRSLVPLKIDNLLVAGRCISAEFDANAAVRVIATVMSSGQAAGIAAAMCMEKGLPPRELEGKLVRKEMIKLGVPLDKELKDERKEALKEEKGEFIILPGDFIGVLTSEGVKTQVQGLMDFKKHEDKDSGKENK